MHIPDGFLTTSTWVSTGLISIGGVGYCVKKATGALKEKMVPLMGVMSAFIFAAQMVNFPVMAGTSGHLLGGVLAAILLGPYAGAIVISVVLIAQCFIFQDGGLTALGANILNMAIIGSIGGYCLYRCVLKILKNKKNGMVIATAVSAWVSVVSASAACALELVVSQVAAFKTIFPVMLGVHALIGAGEAVITCCVMAYIVKVRPDLIYKP
jgi:cobalt/nickel transport system permease protein